MEYLSRIDGQVKLFGLFIETGKVEGVILDVPDLMSCTVAKVEQEAFVCLAKQLLDNVLAGKAGREKTSDPSQLWMAIHGNKER